MEGDFTRLAVLDSSGAMTDILDLITVGSAGAITTLTAGANITITGSGSNRTIAATGGGGGQTFIEIYKRATVEKFGLHHHGL